MFSLNTDLASNGYNDMKFLVGLWLTYGSLRWTGAVRQPNQFILVSQYRLKKNLVTKQFTILPSQVVQRSYFGKVWE